MTNGTQRTKNKETRKTQTNHIMATTLNASQTRTLYRLETALRGMSLRPELKKRIARDLAIMQERPESTYGKRLWAKQMSFSKLVGFEAATPDADVQNMRQRDLQTARESMRGYVPTWDELFARAGLALPSNPEGNLPAQRATPARNQGARPPRGQQEPPMSEQAPAAGRNQRVAQSPVAPRRAPAGGDNEGAPQPLYNAYTVNEDLDWTGGEQIRSIYCGLDPDKLPPGAVFGNRLQCLRKGVMRGRGLVHT